MNTAKEKESELSKHFIGAMPLLKWVEGHKYRNYFSFEIEEQLDYATKIARIEDKKARELMLELFEKATRLQKFGTEMHKEFDTLHLALTKIHENLIK